MKKEKLILIYIVVTALLGAGCNKWLDVRPKTQVEANQLFTSEKGFEDAMYGVYTIMAGSSLYGDQLTMSFLDVLAQRYDCSSSSHNYHQASLYNYENASVKGRIAQVWDTMYHAVVNLNNVLRHIDDQRGVFQPGNYELVKGEALGLRAFLHFDLLRMFGPSYISGPNKPAIPYVTTVSGGVTPFSTVNVVLDSIISELRTASALLNGYKNINYDYSSAENRLQNGWLNRRQNHFNYWAAEAALARVYLYKGDKANALIHAENVIHSGLFPFQDPARISNLQDRTFIPEQVFALSKFNLRPQVALYFQTSGTVSVNASLQLTNKFGNTEAIGQLFEVASGGITDIRYARLWELSGPIYFCTKYWQVSGNPIYNNIVPLIRIPELYYIAAECSGGANAISYLNEVRARRGLQALPNGLDATAIQNEIFKEYQKEFYAEGQLFYYYKRLQLPQIRFTTIPASDNIYIIPLPDAERLYRDN